MNGNSALLHLVRASLKHYETDVLKTKLLSKCGDILEPPTESESAYSINVLLNENNMKLPIYADKDDVEPDKDDEHNLGSPSLLKRKRRFYRLEDRVEELYEVIEKLIDHQVDKAGQAGLKIKAHARRRLEGWDFKDLASDKDPIYPRGEILHAIGRGWVDFVRSIQAVTLFGKGFGEIIQPLNEIVCPHWVQVPKEKFYLTACVSDLQQIMELEGDDTATPMRICHEISWFSPTPPFDACQCAKTQSRSHSDLVQVLWPTLLTKRFPHRKSISLHQEGAVIFGHNANFKWKWGDTGDPVEGDPTEEQDDVRDNATGSVEPSSSGQGDQSTPNDYSTPGTSLQPLQITEQNSEEIAPDPNEPIDHQEAEDRERYRRNSSTMFPWPTSKRSALMRKIKGKLSR